ncbi:MAG TPA: cell wall-binding repeat-containing protein [Nocardioidaceae bacterium]
MRRPHSRSRAAVSAALAVALAAGSTSITGPTSAAEAEPAPVRVTNEDFHFAWDEGSGCGINERVWEVCAYSQHGLGSFARVVRDPSAQAGGNGSLRMTTPNPDDRILLQYFGRADGSGLPRFDEITQARVAIRVVAGEAPRFGLDVDCAGEESAAGEGIRGITYAGPYPAEGAGWQVVDLVQDGQALWQDGSQGGPRPLAEYQAECPDGAVTGYRFELATPGSESRVDELTLGDHVLDFWIPPLTRVDGHDRRRPPAEAVGERLTVRELISRLFVTDAGYSGYSDDEWANPTRPRLPVAKAAVIAAQDFPRTALVAGPLANAVRGPLLVNPRDTLPHHTDWALRTSVARGSTVYLVGNPEQLGRRVARSIEDIGYEVVRLGGSSDATTAVKVARVIDRRRRGAASVVLTDGRRLDDALVAPAVAGRVRGAVLLTRGQVLPRVTRRYLADHRDAAVYAVGERAAAARPGLPAARKLFGRTPYATSAQVANRLFPDPTSAVLAPGRRATYALLAASHSGSTGQPMLLLRRDSVPGSVAAYLREHHDDLAGSLLVADARGVSDTGFLRAFRILDYS